MSDPAGRWLARTASDFRADGVAPLAAVATLALHGRAPSDLPGWCDVVDHLSGGSASALDPPAGVPICDLLGPLYELMLADAARRAAGVHFTRPALASGLVALAAGARPADGRTGGTALDAGEVALDPACGAGAFLVAVARHLVATSTDPSDPAAHPPTANEALTRLVGADLDADALVVARAALARWALDEGGHRVGVALNEPALTCCDSLTQPEELVASVGDHAVGLIVGNPPFLAQLRAGTRHDAERRASLASRFGAAVGAYTDTAALFLLAATELISVGGAVCLVQPRSVLAARDARAVRAELVRRTEVCAAWVGDGGFGASVEVWAPVLIRRGARVTEVRVVGGAEAEHEVGRVPADVLRQDSWGALVATAEGLPALRSPTGRSAGRLGEVARFSAGFRDEYYAMLELAKEAPGFDGAAPDEQMAERALPAGYAALVSSGLIDPGVCRWGRKPMRFGKRPWRAPVVALAALDDPDHPGATWARRQLVPKVLVASQTRVIEAAPDGQGRAIGLTPVISGVPDGIDLAHLLAVLCSPVSTLAVVSAMAGSGLGRAGVRVSTSVLADLELPVHRAPWDEAAALLAGRCSLGSGVDPATMQAVRELMLRASGIGNGNEVRAWFETLAGPPPAN